MLLALMENKLRIQHSMSLRDHCCGHLLERRSSHLRFSAREDRHWILLQTNRHIESEGASYRPPPPPKNDQQMISSVGRVLPTSRCKTSLCQSAKRLDSFPQKTPPTGRATIRRSAAKSPSRLNHVMGALSASRYYAEASAE